MTNSPAACPRCASKRIKRSHSRSIFERCLKTLHIRAYRCIHCGWRGYRIDRGSKRASTAKYSLLQFILIVIVLAVAVVLLLYYLTREEPKEEIISHLQTHQGYQEKPDQSRADQMCPGIAQI